MKIKIKPALGADGLPLRTRHPSAINQLIPSDGAEVPLDKFTRRRLRDGDWVEVKDEATAAAARTRSKND